MHDGETWAQRAADRLAALKLTGWSFERCWSIVLLEDPIDWRRDFGIRGSAGTFDSMLEEQQTEAWLRGVFAAAWANEPGSERLRYLELPAQIAA